jgi:hypothetical protein
MDNDSSPLSSSGDRDVDSTNKDGTQRRVRRNAIPMYDSQDSSVTLLSAPMRDSKQKIMTSSWRMVF